MTDAENPVVAVERSGAIGHVTLNRPEDGLRLPLEGGLALERETVISHITGDSGGAGIATFTASRGAQS